MSNTGYYKTVSLRRDDFDRLDQLAKDTGLNKTVLLRKLITLGAVNVRRLLMIDVPPSVRAVG